MNKIFLAGLCLVAVALAGCSGDTRLPDPTGKGNVRAINAISSSPTVAFLIEERQVGTVEYKNSTAPAAYDDFSYRFNFQAQLAGDSSATRIASRQLQIVKDVAYTFVLSGTLVSPTVTIWERPDPALSVSDSEFEVQFAHLAASLAVVDVYFAAPGTAPAAGNDLGQLAFGEILPVASYTPGDYVLTLTAAGNPGDILYESETLPVQAGVALILSAFDPDAADTAPVAMRVINLGGGTSGALPDPNYPATFRFTNASISAGAVDIYIDDPLTTPLVPGLAFADSTDRLEIDLASFPLTITTAGNMGSILVDVDRSAALGTRRHLILAENDAGEYGVIDYVPNLRSIETLAKMTVINTAAIDQDLDVYVLPRDAALDEDATPILPSYPVGAAPLTLTSSAGSFDLYVTATGDLTALAGPVPIDFEFGGFYETIIRETGDPSVLEIAIDSFP